MAMKIDLDAARILYARLPPALRLATLSPDYVLADATRSSEIQPIYWCYREGHSFWCHAFHLTPLPGGVAGYDIQSPYGYGGPIANSEDHEFLVRAWHAYSEAARAQGIATEFVRFHPLAQNYRFYGGAVEKDRLTVWMDLELDDLFAGYQTRARTAIRKAQHAGVTFKWAESHEIVDQFAAFYRESMAAIAASPFYFFEDTYFGQLAKMPCTRLAVCSLDGEWLSAGLFLYGADSVEYHLAASSENGKRLSASNLLLHEAALSAKLDGYSCLYLGGGTDARPDNSLLFFKAGFSSRRATFSVGTVCHDAALYEALRKRWPDRYQLNPNKIMFYRT
jgi:hypothetical protein